MSETVHYKGKLKKVEFDEQMGFISFEDKCKQLMNRLGYKTLDKDYNSWEDFFRNELYDNLYKEYVIMNNDIYKVVDKRNIIEFDIFELHDNKDGTYNFDVMYYDGGCSFNEAIDYAFENIN